MKLIRISLILFLLIFFFSFPSYAITIRGTPFDSSFHIGLTMGPGTGLNFGIDGLIVFNDFSFGGEIEQLVTNHDFEVNINALRYGGVLKYNVTEEIAIGMHLGMASFNVSRDVEYKDAFTGDYFMIEGETGNSLSYIGLSSDFELLGFVITPKVIINYISNGGAIYEFDLNMGKGF